MKNDIICLNCGCVIEDENDVIYDGNDTYCHDCAAKCDCCGCVVVGDDRIELSDGRVGCSDCTAYCNHCNSFVWADETSHVENTDLYVCDRCVSHTFYVCDDCGGVFKESDVRYDDHTVVCDRCFDRYDYIVCEDCGCITTNCYEGNNGYWYCDSCIEYHSNSLHDYGYKPDPIFQSLNNENPDIYYGVELEVDDGNSVDKLADWVDSCYSDLMYCKEDGSLGNFGVEIVTHPCTINFHMKEFPWDEVVSSARRFGYLSHDTGTCGLHVHASRDFFGRLGSAENDFAVARLIIIVGVLFDDYLIPFSRRKTGELSQWASKNYVCENHKDTTDADKYSDILSGSRLERYRAVNICNYLTVEFRLFKGTLRENTIKATLQLVDKLCRYAKKCTLQEAYDVTWDDIAADMPEEFNTYCRERGLRLPTIAAAA